MRVQIVMSYDGSHFCGFQLQKNENSHSYQSVMGKLMNALKRLHIDTIPMGSGRTDSGVHAKRQILHLDLPSFWENLFKLKEHLNRYIAPHIYIESIMEVDATFHARFSAKKRLYRYVLYDLPYQPFLANYALHVKPVDVTKLNENAKIFVGSHNFEYFKKLGGGTTKDERQIFKAGAYRYQQFIIIYFLGDAFLRSQVRMMTSALLKINDGILTLEDVRAQRDREKKSTTTLVPASGLYLSRIYY